jgi:acetolactate synthase I/III small subunit
VDVRRVELLPPRGAVSRDLAMIKVATSAATRSEIMQLVTVFRARVIDVAPASLIVEITGSEEKVGRLVQVLRPFGILEMVRTGRVAMARGASGDGGATGALDADLAEPSDPEHVSYSV